MALFDLDPIPAAPPDVRTQARRLVARAVQVGELRRPDRCPLCDKERRIDAHHEDYGRPLDVDFRCDRCHAYGHLPVPRVPACRIGDRTLVYVAPRPAGIQVCILAWGALAPGLSLARILALEGRRPRSVWWQWAGLGRVVKPRRAGPARQAKRPTRQLVEPQ